MSFAAIREAVTHFSSLTFLLFAAVVVLVCRLLPKRARWVWLLAASLAFYAAGDWWYLPFLAASVLSTWGLALLIGKQAARDEAALTAARSTLSKDERKALKASQKKKRARLLWVGLVFNFGLLCVLKYTDFVLEGVSGIASLWGAGPIRPLDLILPLGISYYTFRSTAYLIDVFRGKTEAQPNPARYALFISFFPAVVQGPICRYNETAAQLLEPRDADWTDFSAGLLRLLWGYFKKLVVADTAMTAVRAIVSDPERLNGAYAAVLIVVYSAVIYGDFTGGMDISLGLSRMMGITLTENFNRPFSSMNTEEYWNRWHITMGSYFTDYVFYPMSISKPMQRLTVWGRARLGNGIGMRLPVYLATIITWFLTGLWHGASWNFIVWGLLNGAVILISRECKPLYARFHKRFPGAKENRFYQAFCRVRTFLLMGAIRSLDCYRDVGVTFRAFGSIFTRPGTYAELFNGQALEALGLPVASWIMLLAAVVVLWLVGRAGDRKKPAGWQVAEPLSDKPLRWALVCGALLLVILLAGQYGIGFDASDFIYNRF